MGVRGGCGIQVLEVAKVGGTSVATSVSTLALDDGRDGLLGATSLASSAI